MVAFSREAISDLFNIREYVARDSPEIAAKVAAMIRNMCKLLDNAPFAGRPGKEPGTREISTARPWVIIYELTPNGPLILRVWHSSQNRPAT